MELLTFKQLLVARFDQINEANAVAQCHISKLNGDTPEQYAEAMHKNATETITLELMN